MKSLLPIGVLLLSGIFLASCTKTVIDGGYPPPPPQNPIEGSWILTDAAEYNGNGWYGFSTGLENGVFYFHGNGHATYSDNLGTLSGEWFMQTTTGNYYDQYGIYYYGRHEMLEMHLSDNSGSAIDLAFDYVNFSGNRFIATFYNGKYIERYYFSRY